LQAVIAEDFLQAVIAEVIAGDKRHGALTIFESSLSLAQHVGDWGSLIISFSSITT